MGAQIHTANLRYKSSFPAFGSFILLVRHWRVLVGSKAGLGAVWQSGVYSSLLWILPVLLVCSSMELFNNNSTVTYPCPGGGQGL